MLETICVFCGSSTGTNPSYREAAAELGRVLALSGRRLVYGGGKIGLMGVLADAALEHGGEVVGVMPRQIERLEVAHRGIDDLRIVDSMHQRKLEMGELADGFIVLPGGLGTLEEFFEIWTWGQLGLHHKPYGLLNVGSYFGLLLGFLESAVEEGFIRAAHRELLLVDGDPAHLLERMDDHVVPLVPKVVDAATT